MIDQALQIIKDIKNITDNALLSVNQIPDDKIDNFCLSLKSDITKIKETL